MRILAVLESPGRASLETVAAAQALGGELHVSCVGTVAGEFACERVHVVQHELLREYTADGYALAFEQLIRAVEPELVLFPHTYQVRDFAPKLAARFGTSLVGDVVAVGEGWAERQAFQGKLTMRVSLGDKAPAFLSLQAGAFKPENVRQGEAAATEFVPVLAATDIRQKPEPKFQESARTVDLTAAERIVSVGRGIGEQERIEVVEELAKALGAELAASRPICDAGWLPMERQVGSSGQTVAPKLYCAVGISGAIQHQVGMKGSKTIVAINKDPNAPIFEIADYGIVGDLFEVVPAIVEALNS